MSAHLSLLVSTLNDQQACAVERLQRLLVAEQKFAMLCFQCGEGKTLISQETVRRLVQARYIKENSPVLVVCPNSAERAWLDDAKKHFDPPLRVLTVNQSTQHKIVYNDIATYDLVLITSSILRSAFKASCEERRRLIEMKLRQLNTKYDPFADEERMLRRNLELYRKGRLLAKLLSEELKQMEKKPDLRRPLIGLEEEGEVVVTASSSSSSSSQVCLILECIYKHHWSMLIVDEAHEARNENSKLFLHLSQLQAERRLLLTATPCNNYITDVMALFGLGGVEPPNGWQSLKHSMEETASYLQETRDHFVVAHKEVSASHYKPVEIFVRLSMSEEERNAYLEVSDRWRDDGSTRNNSGTDNILSAITRLRKLCDTNTKNKAVRSYVEQVLLPRSERLIVFCNFRKTASTLHDLLRESFGERRLHVALITGDTRKQDERNRIIQQFSRSHSAAVLIVTKVINVGTDIPAANHTITMNEWWNPATKDQAQRRVQRLAQRRSLFHLSFITKNSIEESMFLVSQVKREMSHAVLYNDITEAMMNTVTSRRALEAVDDASPKGRNRESVTYKNILHNNLAQYIKELSSNVYRRQAGDDDGLMRPSSSRDIEHVFRNRCTLMLESGGDFSGVPPTQQIRLLAISSSATDQLLQSFALQEAKLLEEEQQRNSEKKKKTVSKLFKRSKLTTSGRLKMEPPDPAAAHKRLAAASSTSVRKPPSVPTRYSEPVSLRTSSDRQRSQGRTRKMKFIDIRTATTLTQSFSVSAPRPAYRYTATKRKAEEQLDPLPSSSPPSSAAVAAKQSPPHYKGIRNTNQEWISSLASAFKFTSPM